MFVVDFLSPGLFQTYFIISHVHDDDDVDDDSKEN